MWIRGKGDYSGQLINTGQVKKIYIYTSTYNSNTSVVLKACDTRGNDYSLMKLAEKTDGDAIIGKIGEAIAKGRNYLELGTL